MLGFRVMLVLFLYAVFPTRSIDGAGIAYRGELCAKAMQESKDRGGCDSAVTLLKCLPEGNDEGGTCECSSSGAKYWNEAAGMCQVEKPQPTKPTTSPPKTTNLGENKVTTTKDGVGSGTGPSVVVYQPIFMRVLVVGVTVISHYDWISPCCLLLSAGSCSLTTPIQS